jgi:hypothetical protein
MNARITGPSGTSVIVDRAWRGKDMLKSLV